MVRSLQVEPVFMNDPSLTKSFSREVYEQALESWAWIPIGDKAPVMTSLFGDVFLEAPDGFWFLDSLEGKLVKVAESRQELMVILRTEDGQDRYLLRSVARAAEQRGIRLQPNEVYDFVIAPVLGGEIDAKNVQAMDFVVAPNLVGQIHEQVRDLPPGTTINAVQISD